MVITLDNLKVRAMAAYADAKKKELHKSEAEFEKILRRLWKRPLNPVMTDSSCTSQMAERYGLVVVRYSGYMERCTNWGIWIPITRADDGDV